MLVSADPVPAYLQVGLEALRARQGWLPAAKAATRAKGSNVSPRQLRRELRAAGLLDAFPPAWKAGAGRPRIKPPLTDDEVKFAIATRDAPGGTWELAAEAINAARPPAARVSDRWLRDHLKERGH